MSQPYKANRRRTLIATVLMDQVPTAKAGLSAIAAVYRPEAVDADQQFVFFGGIDDHFGFAWDPV